MSDEFDPNEARAFVEARVSSVHQALVLQALGMDDPVEINEIGLLISGEKAATGFVVGTGANRRKGSFWAAVQDEVYEYFCTNTVAYKRERNQASGLFEHSVTIVATALAAKFSLGIGFVTGLVAVAVISVFKMGRNAWCEVRKGQASLAGEIS